MDLFPAVVIGISIVFFVVIYFFDPLEKWDKNLDDPNYKKFEGVYRDLRLGPEPKVSDKRKKEDHKKN